MKKLFIALFAFIALSSAASAFDKKAIIEHIRESYSFPNSMEISLSDPKPSEVPGFDVAELKITRGSAQQTDTLYISKDGRYYMLGGFKDLQHSPDQERIAKMDLTNSPIRGKINAPVTIVEYTDFECPYCELGYQVMRRKIMREYGSKVRWIYKSLPLRTIHPWAVPAALAAACAYRQGQGKFWAMHDDIFDHQKEITPENIDSEMSNFAKDSSLDTTAFATCYKGREAANLVEKDVVEAEGLSIPGTPAFVINGRLIPSADYDSLKETIDGFLKKKA